jgi:hypothetical protein
VKDVSLEPTSESQRLVSEKREVLETVEPVEFAPGVEHGFLSLPDTDLGAAKVETSLFAACRCAFFVG